MASTYYVILTDIGAQKIAASQSGGAQVQLTQIAVGDSNGVYYEPSSAQTALVHEVWRGSIVTLTTDIIDPTIIISETVIPTTVGGFFIREAGLFDVDGDMIAIAKYPVIQKTVVSDGAGEDVAIRFLIKVSTEANVVLTIDPSVVYATIAYVDGKLHNSFGGRSVAHAHPSSAVDYGAGTVEDALNNLSNAIAGIRYINNKTYFIGGF